jgi:plastocyanin
MKIAEIAWLSLAALALALLVAGTSRPGFAGSSVSGAAPTVHIIVPDEDRFIPFAVTVRVGQKVEWINNDTDDHTVVSDDAFNTAGHRGVNMLLPANGGSSTLTFEHPGVFPFYCRFHATLDADNQPKAPGPDGGIQDPDGNFGTPMNGVVTVLSKD